MEFYKNLFFFWFVLLVMVATTVSGAINNIESHLLDLVTRVLFVLVTGLLLLGMHRFVELYTNMVAEWNKEEAPVYSDDEAQVSDTVSP